MTAASELDIARRALQTFGLRGRLRRVAFGLDHMYRVVDGAQKIYAMRVSGGKPMRNRSAFLVEASWIQSLSDERLFRVPVPRLTIQGELVGEVLDDAGQPRAVMLLPWIAGRRSRRHITLAHARMLGRIAATLHTQARTRALPPSGAIKLWGRERISGAVLAGSEIGQVLPSVSGVIQAIDTAVFDALNSISSTEFGLINAHLGVHNVLWHASGPGLVDFNDSGIGPYAFCFARLRAQLARRENGQALTLGLVKGYQEICALPEGVTMQPGIFDIAADLFLARYTAAKLSRAGAFNKRVAVQLFGEFRSRLAALSGHATM